tara:strand:- start:94 stop:462 length:369 start_codon:yes stop_codon:yes gene_type:complete
MDNQNIKFTQCYWHANGNLDCNNVSTNYDENRHNTNTVFDDFSTPNQNYRPNEYRKNKDYYEAALNYTCNTDPSCNCSKPSRCNVPTNCSEKQDNLKWLAEPRTYDRVNYLTHSEKNGGISS